jgi:hypothetical protein
MFNKTFLSILCLLFSIYISLLYFKKNSEYETFISQSQQEKIKSILISNKTNDSDKINQLKTIRVDDKIYNNIISSYSDTSNSNSQPSLLSSLTKYLSSIPSK